MVLYVAPMERNGAGRQNTFLILTPYSRLMKRTASYGCRKASEMSQAHFLHSF